MTNSDPPLIRLLLKELSDQGFQCFVSPYLSLVLEFYGIQKFNIMQNRERNILTWFMKVKKIQAVFFGIL